MENSNEKEDMRALIMVFVIWLLLWCVDNRQYFFEYLPHHSDYEIVAAYKAFMPLLLVSLLFVFLLPCALRSSR